MVIEKTRIWVPVLSPVLIDLIVGSFLGLVFNEVLECSFNVNFVWGVETSETGDIFQDQPSNQFICF